MDQLLMYIINWFKTWERGDTPNYPDPDPPADLGSALTQDEIDWVKKMKKEIDERFAPLP